MTRFATASPLCRGGFLAAFVLALASRAMAGPTACSQADIERTAAGLQQARQTLLRLPIGDGLNPEVSEPARRAIGGMQGALNEFIVAYMACLSVAKEPNVSTIGSDLSRLGNAFALERGRSYSSDELPANFANYGFELSFEVRAMPGPKPRIGITAEFSIECGSDTVLWVFTPESEGWREVLRWESPPYDTVAGAFWVFDYSMSPADSNGEWYVVTKDVAPWCSSTWSGIRYAVLRPVSGTPVPRVLLSADESIWWGNEDFGRVQANREDFEVRYHAASIDGGVHNREVIRRYSIHGDSIRRIAPVAASPRDFVDEWINLPWPEAAQWSDRGSLGRLQFSHQDLHEASSHRGFMFESVYLCSGARDLYQVEVSLDDKDSYFFLVSADGPLTMKAVSKRPRPGCGGNDLLDSMATN